MPISKEGLLDKTYQTKEKQEKKMALQSDEQVLHSQTHIWNHIFSFINSMSLKCAIQLEIPDIIERHGAPMLLSELVDALSINKERAPFVYRLMRLLVHSGFFVKQKVSEESEEGYLLAPASRFLLKEEPLSIRPFLLAMLDPIVMDPWQHLSKWFQNNDINPFYTAHGKNPWELLRHKPELIQLTNEGWASDSRLVTSVILKQSGTGSAFFEGLNSIVDVGGGTGTVAKAIADAFPKLSCISFDLPQVVNGLVGGKNLSFIGGDMFQEIPKADAVLLKWILHGWNDEECLKILKRCKEAIPSKENGGKVIIIDMVVKDHQGPGDDEFIKAQLFFDMLMMASQTGRERNEKDWAKLFLDAGFSDYKITHNLGSRSFIEVYP